MKRYSFINDPGHGWLRVPYQDLVKSGVESKITKYSYRSREFAYLEEDCDAGTFLQAIKAQGIKYKLLDQEVEDFDVYMREHKINFRFP